MAATTLVRARVKTERMKKVVRILDRMGLKPADVVNMVFAQIEQRRALPFDVADAGDDYAFQEYGVTKAEMERFEKRLAKDIARERKAGTIRELKSWRDLRGRRSISPSGFGRACATRATWNCRRWSAPVGGRRKRSAGRTGTPAWNCAGSAATNSSVTPG